jgi:hypothetical protein
MATRLQLRLHIDPSEVLVFCNLERKDGILEKLSAIIDTGAAVSLLPDNLLDVIIYRPTEEGTVTIEQAGIAAQSFQAVEAFVTISLEDAQGNLTQSFEIRAWFGKTEKALIGFEDILDRAVLHIDMPQRTGWLEIDA